MKLLHKCVLFQVVKKDLKCRASMLTQRWWPHLNENIFENSSTDQRSCTRVSVFIQNIHFFTQFLNEKKKVTDFAFSPHDDGVIASGSQDGTVKVLETES